MKKTRIIIADDNREINNFIKQFIEAYEEFEIIGCCYTGEEEIDMIRKYEPDIVITDLIRGDTQSGLTVIRKCKKDKCITHFLVITAADRELIDMEIMDGYIQKPITDYNLIINELIRIKKQIVFERLHN